MSQQSDVIEIGGQKPCCISFNSSIVPATSSPLMGALSNVTNDGYDEIHLFLNTPGGTVPDGIAIHNFILALPVPVVIYNIGTVNSIGNVVYQAGKRKVSAPSSSFMFHGVGFDITNARFEMKQLREKVSSLENDQALISEIIVRHTKLSAEDVDKLFLEMAFMSAQDALERGITDEVREINLPSGMPIIQLMFQG